MQTTERKQRKSVAFSEGATVVDGAGHVAESATEMNDKQTAESHTAGDGDGVDDMTDMFKDLAKKKKKTTKPKDEEVPAADVEFDPSALKKKKKKKAVKVGSSPPGCHENKR